MDSIAVTESLMTKRQSLESTVGARAMTPNTHRRRQRTKVRAPKSLPPKKTTVTHQWETAEEKLQSGTMESCNDWFQEPYKTDSPTSNSVCSDYSLHGTCMLNTWQSWQLLHFFLWCHRWFKKTAPHCTFKAFSNFYQIVDFLASKWCKGVNQNSEPHFI